jgi:hypothetical protein
MIFDVPSHVASNPIAKFVNSLQPEIHTVVSREFDMQCRTDSRTYTPAYRAKPAHIAVFDLIWLTQIAKS